MYLIALLFITVLSAGLGQSILYFFKIKIEPNYRPLTALILGLLAVVSFYSILITQGKTVHLAFFILGFLAYRLLYQEGYLLANRAAIRLFYKEDLKEYRFFLAAAFFWLLYFYSVFQCYTYGKEGVLSLVFEDVLYYSAVGEWISDSGQENMLGSSQRLDSSFVGMVPFHYFEIYFGQLLADIFSLNALKSHIYLTNTFSVALISYAISTFAKQLLGKGTSIYFVITGLVAVWYSGIQLPVPLREAGHYIMPLLELNTMKFGFIFLFFLIGTYMALIGSLFFVLPFLVIPIMTYTLFPAFLIAFPMMALGGLVYFYYNKKSSKIIYYYLVGGILISVFLLGIYDLWGMSEEFQRAKIDIALLATQLTKNWRTSIGIIVGTHLYFLVDYIPFVIITGFFWWRWGTSFSIKELSIQLLIIPLLFLSATISWAVLLFITQESFQIHAIITGFVGNVGIIFTTILTYKKLQKNKKWYLLAQVPILMYLVYFNLYHNSRTYNRERAGVISIEAVEQIIPYISNKNARIATLDSTARRQEVYPYGAWLAYYKERITLTSISPVLLTNEYDYQSIATDNLAYVLRISTPFYRYVQQLKEEQQFIDILSAQLSFLKHYQVDFVLVEHSFVDTVGLLKQLTLEVKTDLGDLYRIY